MDVLGWRNTESVNLTSPRVTVHLEDDQKMNGILIQRITNQRPLHCNGYTKGPLNFVKKINLVV